MFRNLKNIVLFFLIWNCSSNDDNQMPTPLKNTDTILLGGSLNESASSIIKTLDGGYAILGFTQSKDGDIKDKTNESYDYWLLKFDNSNTLQWQKTYGGSNEDRGSKVIQTSDNGFALIGFSKSSNGHLTENNGFDDFWILKLDDLGHISWQKSFGFSGVDSGISVIQTNDGGFLLLGVLDVTASNGEGNSKSSAIKHAGGDYWAIKLSVNGEKQWSKFYGGSFTDTPYQVIQTQDNGYIIVGSSDSNDVDISNNKGGYDFWVIKISEAGTLIWEKSFGGSQIDEARDIIATNDGHFLIVGDTRSNDKDVTNNKGAADIWLIKITSNGELIWQKTIGGTGFDAARSIKSTMDGGYLIVGNSRSEDGDTTTNSGQNDAWILKLNHQANLQWQNSIGGTGTDLAFDAIEQNDNTIITVGESGSPTLNTQVNKGFTDLMVLHIK